LQSHLNYVGDLGLAAGPDLFAGVLDADLLVVVGARRGELTTAGYTLVDIPCRSSNSCMCIWVSKNRGACISRRSASTAPWQRSLARRVRWNRVRGRLGHPIPRRCARPKSRRSSRWVSPGVVQMSEVVRWQSGRVPADTIVTNGAGNYSAWLQRYFQYKGFRTQLAPTNGSTDYGVPAAVAAKRIAPDRMVIAFAGDGCFLMNGQELATPRSAGRMSSSRW
jgi:acetolactate synthase-1/2/3 large subunit